MPSVSNTTKLAIFSATHPRILLRFQSRPFSSSSVPSHQHIAHLILDQKSPSQALQTFRWAAKLPNFIHNQSTYRAVIHKLCTFRRFETVKELLDEMPGSIGCPPDEDVFVTIVRGLGRARMTREATKVLDLVARFEKDPSLKIFNSILDVLVKEDIDFARDFYRKKMMGCGIQGDDYTFGILMKGLCLTNRIADGFKLLQLMKSRGITPNTVIYNTLIHALCKNGKTGRGRSLMSEMMEPNEVTVNVLISAYCRDGNLVQALVLLEKSFSLGFVPDVVTITKVVEILCNEGRIREAVEVLERVEEKGGTTDAVAYNTLIRGFCKLGKANVGCRFLKEMESKGCLPNVHTYNALISGFCESGDFDSALDLFREMIIDGINPTFGTYDTLVRGMCSGGRMEDGFKILGLMEESKGGSGGQISPYNGVIYGLYKENRLDEALQFLTRMRGSFPRAVDRSLRILGFCEEGNMEEAKRVYDQMIREGGIPSALVYDRLIGKLCQGGDVRVAFDLINDMIDHGYFPIASTFNELISGFCKQGKVGSASKFMEEMVERRCLTDTGSYSPLIDALCKKGYFEKAVVLLLHMVDRGVTPDYFIWNALLLCLSQETMWLESRNIPRVSNLLNWIHEN
ncbi:PREDICTED: pentatricopeptide repeat-containing protein At2g17525, mitochondrial [Nelumbo nucifera]|uniref:Pentatricopeptide repeat-containing protein At2g17525, mitochondrial n=2 Tax=Nelumbo nucifera TaxID=4432 RepID=A0A1U8AGI4_NELNU|nr:PREDICTED: pentatricopeptide repeat-containing protein At2g17525, mitochondrial [Nelumbo nucifera]DAD41844.1 TPA_asm: hypothetical protein HUJ06_016167 [Nelumbo nucifera]